MRRVLCIALGEVDISNVLPDEMNEWGIDTVSSLAEAKRALRTRDHTVGLVLHPSNKARTAEIASFLRQYSHMQWIGVFRPRDLEAGACRDLILQYFCDFHTFPVDTVRLAYTLGHAHGWRRCSKILTPTQCLPSTMLGH
jgi:hypothetical protein